jgi:hypothetical protein
MLGEHTDSSLLTVAPRSTARGLEVAAYRRVGPKMGVVNMVTSTTLHIYSVVDMTIFMCSVVDMTIVTTMGLSIILDSEAL